MLFFLILIILKNSVSVVIIDNFKYCDYTNSLNVYLDVENSCGFRKSPLTENFSLGEGKKDFAVLVKQKHLIHGIGYQCRKEIIENNNYENLFGNQHTTTFITTIRLSQAECEYMVKTKQCDGLSMECDGENCYVERKPLKEFYWFRNLTTRGLKCSITTRLISADNIKTNLFNSHIHNCTAELGECQLSDSTIIWNKSIIQKCPLQFVGLVNFNLTSGNLFLAEKERIGFHVIESTNECNVPIFKTQEGFYLAHGKEAAKFEKSNDSLNILNYLKMNERDFETYEKSKSSSNSLAQRTCYAILNLIRTMGKDMKDFVVVTDFRGNELILVNEFGTLLIPQCIQVKEIRLHNTSYCYHDLPVSFILQYKRITGFLSHNNILKRSSDLVDCETMKDKVYHLKTSNIALRQLGNRITIERKENVIFKTTSLFNVNVTNLNFAHPELFLNGLELVKSMNYLQSMEEIDGSFLVENKILEKKRKSKMDFLMEEIDMNWLKGKEYLIILGLFLINLFISLCAFKNKK